MPSPNSPVSVSIIIPCHNRIDCTQSCWQALQRTLPAGCEVILVDNASTDGTVEFLKGLGDPARIILNETNNGFARASNQGVRAAVGKYLLFLNNDTIPSPNWLEPMVAVLENDGSVAIVGSKLLYPDGRIQHAGVVVQEKSRDGILRMKHIHRFSSGDAPWVNLQCDFQTVTGACLLIRQEVFQEVGCFDEAFVNGYEDIDLCFKIRQRGHRIVYCPESELIHLESSTEGRHADEDANLTLFNARWGGHIESDEKEFYTRTGRKDYFELGVQLKELREHAIRIGHFATVLDPAPKSPSRWRERLRDWLFPQPEIIALAKDIKLIRSCILRLERGLQSVSRILEDRNQSGPVLQKPRKPHAD